MPTLDWIGKNAVVGHHKEVPYRFIMIDTDVSAGAAGEGNLLIEGDNLHALKALLPYYGGKVKCICIDPPYNTGEQTWTYNDKVNSPEISKWLGKTVGREAEDLSRHDKWLCMMFPRIQLLLKFLRPDGVLFVCLDDTEMYRFKVMMDEMLSPDCFISSLLWKSRRNLDSRNKHNVSIDHEYVLAFKMPQSRFKGAAIDKEKYSNPDNDPRGAWMSDNLVGLATKDRRPNLHYDLVNPKTGIVYKCHNKGWRYSQETMAEKIRDGRIIWPKSPSGRPRHKKYIADLQSEFTGFSSIIESGNTNEGTEEVQNILGKADFIFPKPRSLIQSLIAQVATGKGDIVLDSFAGSGTTGHAVLQLNEDGNDRRFILIEMDQKISSEVTAERLKRVINGYGDTPGLSGGFRFCTLAEPLFDERGQINSNVKFSDLAHHVFFTETGEPMPKRPDKRTPLLGVHNGRAIYLLFNGILGDKQPQGGNVLTNDVLKILPQPNHDFAGARVIYGTACRLSANRLKREGVTFRQIPYEIKTN